MDPKDVIQHYGNGKALDAAIKLGLTKQAIHTWVRNGWIPLEWQRWIEEDTAGRFKADRRRPNDPNLRKQKVTDASERA